MTEPTNLPNSEIEAGKVSGEPAGQLGAHMIATDLYSPKALQTLAGAAGAVWLVCLVTAGVIGRDNLSPAIMRVIALLLSEGFALSMYIVYIYKKNNNVYVGVLVAFLNGLLVFVNASGMNAINTGITFEDKESIRGSKASLINFGSDLNWWPDQSLVNRVDSLQEENDKLKKQLKKLVFANSSVEKTSSKFSQGAGKHTFLSREEATKNALVGEVKTKHVHSKRNFRKLAAAYITSKSAAATTTTIKATKSDKIEYKSIVEPDSCVISAEETDSGCQYNILLRNIAASFAGKNDTLRNSTVSFVATKASETCRGKYEVIINSACTFTYASIAYSKSGEIFIGYNSSSSLYTARAYGRFVDNKFDGTLIIERPKRRGQPSFRKILKVTTYKK